MGYKDPTAAGTLLDTDWDSESMDLLDEYLDSERTTEQHAC